MNLPADKRSGGDIAHEAQRPSGRKGVVVGLPLKGSSYTEPFYAKVAELDIEVREGVWAGRWLLENLNAGDVVHLHWPSFIYYDPSSRKRTLWRLLKYVVILSLLRARGVRFVWTAHNLYPHDGGKAVWAHRVGRKVLLAMADTVLAHGPSAAAIVSQEFRIPARMIRTIPHGNWIGQYPDTASPAQARERLGIAGDAYVFAFIGLCKPYKGLEALIDAFSRTGAGCSLLIAGQFQSAEYLAQIEAEINRLPPGTISFHPRFIQDSELQFFLKAADVVVVPYREVLTSGSVMLAMSFGRPVVAPNRGAIADFVSDDCGQLYDPDRANSLEEALRAVKGRRFDEGHILRHVARFTWDEAAQVLRSIVHRSSDEARAGSESRAGVAHADVGPRSEQ